MSLSLATLTRAVEKPITLLAGAAANPLNIALDIQTVLDLKAALARREGVSDSLGVKP